MIWLDDEAPAVETRPPVAVIERPARSAIAPPAPRPAAGPGRAENQYTLIYGKKGQGKTIALRKIVASRIRAGGSVTLVDRTGRNGDLGVVVTSPAQWWAHVRAARREGRPFALVMQPGRGVKLDPLWAMVYEVGGSLLAIDEAEAYANAHRIDPELDELVSLGRNKWVDIAVTVRTPPELHGRLRGNADIVLSFCQPSRMYAESLAKEFFHDPKVADILLKLPKFHYLRAAEGNVYAGRLIVPREYGR